MRSEIIISYAYPKNWIAPVVKRNGEYSRNILVEIG